jgi:hypothetical protein
VRSLAEWVAFGRGTDYGLTEPLPIDSLQIVKAHIGVDKAVLTTPFSAARWDALQPGQGLAAYRNGVQKFSGPVTMRQFSWSAEDGSATIRVEAAGDQIDLADRLVFPDPLRAADDQSVNDYWTYTGVASAAMRQLISDQAGATCASSRRVAGLGLGVDPNVGVSQAWQGLFQSVLELLQSISAASGVNLGLRVTSATSALTASIVAPRDLSGSVILSADLSNVGGTTFAEAAPQVTHALAAGQGDLHLRQRKLVAATDGGSTRWGRQVWSYIDRRDSADATVLTQAATDAINRGPGTVSLSMDLLDSEAATYEVDWDLGDKVTAYVGLPGQPKLAVVSDVVRELTFTVDRFGAESIRPAIGSVDARTSLPTPQQRTVTNLVRRLAALIRNK